jgi:hypothetical protein
MSIDHHGKHFFPKYFPHDIHGKLGNMVKGTVRIKSAVCGQDMQMGIPPSVFAEALDRYNDTWLSLLLDQEMLDSGFRNVV